MHKSYARILLAKLWRCFCFLADVQEAFLFYEDFLIIFRLVLQIYYKVLYLIYEQWEGDLL